MKHHVNALFLSIACAVVPACVAEPASEDDESTEQLEDAQRIPTAQCITGRKKNTTQDLCFQVGDEYQCCDDFQLNYTCLGGTWSVTSGLCSSGWVTSSTVPAGYDVAH